MGTKTTSHIVIKKNSKNKDDVLVLPPIAKEIHSFNFTKEYIKDMIKKSENTPESKEVKNILFNIMKPGGSIYVGKYEKKGCFEILEPIFSNVYDSITKKEGKNKKVQNNTLDASLDYKIIKRKKMNIGDYDFEINHVKAYTKDNKPDLESEYNYISLNPSIKGEYQQSLGGTIRVHSSGLVYLQFDTKAKYVSDYMNIYMLSLYYMMYQPEDLKDMLKVLAKKGKIIN